jgi:uncharacterized membrane protein YhaH (DUF805 family)
MQCSLGSVTRTMALTECPECAGSVSDLAAACPHCGYPIKPPSDSRPASAAAETIPWDEEPLTETGEAILLGRFPNNPKKRMKARRQAWHMIAAGQSSTKGPVTGGQRPWNWNRMLDFTSRTTRSEYWAALALAFLLAIGGAFFGSGAPDLFRIVGGFVGLLLYLWIVFGAAVNRTHDMGVNGFWASLLLLPVVAPVVIIWLGSAPSQPQSNEWGPPVARRRS